jgi:hypothetical protein
MYCTLARERSHFDGIHAEQKSVVFLHGVTARCAVRRAPEMGNQRFELTPTEGSQMHQLFFLWLP